MRQHNSNLPREILQNLQQAISEMNNITNNLKKENTDVAAAKGTRALNNLNRLQDLLQQSQKKSLRERLEGLQQKFQSIADSQKELKDDVQNLSSRSESDPDDELQKAKEKQARIKNDFSEAEKQLKNLLNQSRQNQRETARATQELNKEINRSKIVQKMEAAQKLLEQKKLSSALNAEKDILNSLERVTDKLTGVRSALAETDEEKLDIVLNQTRRLRDNLESIQNRSREELQRKNDGKAQNRQAGAGEVAPSQEQLDPQQLNWLNEGLQRSLSELEMLRQGVKTDPNLTQELNKIGENLRNITRTFRGGVQNRIELIESQVLDLLRSFEVEIAQKLEILKSKEKLFLAREEKIPSEFQKLVEKYYEELSKTK